jgi:hypothetical protein
MPAMPLLRRDILDTLVLVLAVAAGCGSSSASAPDATVVAPDASADAALALDGAATSDALADASLVWPDAAPGAVPACSELPPATNDVLLAGAFTSLWIDPAPAGPAPTADFQQEISGVLSVDVPVPSGDPILDRPLDSANSQRFAVAASDGRRLTVSYEVEYGTNPRPLATALKTLAGHQVSLRYLARTRPEWSTAFVVADRQGVAFAFDAGLRGHTLAANDLGGLVVQPGRAWCAQSPSCPGASFGSLQIAAATDVEIPPAEERSFMFGGSAYTAANIRHDLGSPGCSDSVWAAWALWRQ